MRPGGLPNCPTPGRRQADHPRVPHDRRQRVAAVERAHLKNPAALIARVHEQRLVVLTVALARLFRFQLRTHPTGRRYVPTTRGFRLVHVQESANPRASKPGGIAYHHISDTYIALFTHFIPCGVWEAVYIIEGLLKNTSEVKPTTVHADTQGQSFPVFALAHLLGFDLMPRIRNWKDLTFYRPSKQSRVRAHRRPVRRAGQATSSTST